MRRSDGGVHNQADHAQDAAKEAACRCYDALGQSATPQPHQDRDCCRRVQEVGQQKEADHVVILRQERKPTTGDIISRGNGIVDSAATL